MNLIHAVEKFSMRQSKKTQISTLGIIDSEDFGKLEKKILGCKTSRSQKLITVLILSPNPLIRTFLQEILAFQGYQSEDATELDEVFGKSIPPSGQVVFLDGVYLLGFESDEVSHRVQEFIQSGERVVLLADRRWNDDLRTRMRSVEGYQILWKPLDYRQVGQVMAQLGFRS